MTVRTNYQEGGKASASDLNERGRILNGFPLQAPANSIVDSDGRIYTRSVRATESGVSLVRMEITALANDTLTAQRLDDSDTKVGPALTAHKPWKLQHDAAEYPSATSITTTDTNTVTASDGSSDETWVVTPIYTVGDVIFAFQFEGVWYDANIDGRAWAVAA